MASEPSYSPDSGSQSKPKISHELTRSLISALHRDQGLWQDDFHEAACKILKICTDSLDCEVASIWRKDSETGRLSCILRYEMGLGEVSLLAVPDAQEPDGQDQHAPNGDIASVLLDSAVTAIDNCKNNQYFSEEKPDRIARPDIQSLLSATLYRGGLPSGLMIFETLGVEKQWTSEEELLAQSMADLMGQLLLSLAYRNQTKMFELLNGITKISAGEFTPESLVELLMDQLHELVPDAWIGFYQMTSDHIGELMCAVGNDMPRYVKIAVGTVELEDELFETLAYDAEIYAVSDCNAWDESINLPSVDIAQSLNFECIFFVPVIQDHKLLGFLQVWGKDRSLIFEERRQIYRSLGAIFSVSYNDAIRIKNFRHQTNHDDLTGLSNRDQLLMDFNAIDRDKPYLMLLIQLTDFAQIHNSLGQELADEVLRVVSTRLLDFAADREDTQVYRFTGTEFCLIVADPLGVNSVAQQLLDVILPPIDIDGLSIVVRPVIGMTLTPEHGDQCEALLKNMSEAVNDAKQKSLALFLYEPDEEHLLSEDRKLVRDLKLALDDDQLTLYYQPGFDLDTGKMHSCQALLRWEHKELGFVSPDRLVKLAESAGLMKTLTRWVIKQTISQMSIFNLMELDLFVSINISPLDLVDPELPAFIDQVLQEFSVNASELHVEVSETALMSDFQLFRKSLKALGKIGVGIDIDNFGLGYSSIANLYELPLSSLKIDRYFVNDLLFNDSHEAVVRSIIGMAHGLGIKVVGEGVEDQATIDQLKLMGCDMAQGYAYGHPVPAADFIAAAGE